jgi:hypothetical protein
MKPPCISSMVSGLALVLESAWSPARCVCVCVCELGSVVLISSIFTCIHTHTHSILANFEAFTVGQLMEMRAVVDINGVPEQVVSGVAGMVAAQASAALGMEANAVPLLGALSSGQSGNVGANVGDLVCGMVDGAMAGMFEELGLEGPFKDMKVRGSVCV